MGGVKGGVVGSHLCGLLNPLGVTVGEVTSSFSWAVLVLPYMISIIDCNLSILDNFSSIVSALPIK